MTVKFSRKAFVLAFALTMAGYAVAWALTVSQIYSRVWDSSNSAIRVNKVAG